MEITNTEIALNVWRKDAQVLTPIMMLKISRYIEKVDVFFDDTIYRYRKRYIDISIYRVITTADADIQKIVLKKNGQWQVPGAESDSTG